MKGFILGVICGIAGTLAVMYWNANDSARLVLDERKEMPAAADQAEAPAMPNPEDAGAPPANSSRSATAPSHTTTVTASTGTVAASDQLASHQTTTSSRMDSSQSVEPGSSNPAAITPMFADFFTMQPGAVVIPEPLQLHRKLDAEVEDELWSRTMEATLRDYLQRQAGIERIEIFIIQCRTTICEIQAAGSAATVPNTPVPTAPQTDPVFQNALTAVKQQPWGSEFSDVRMTMTPRDDRTLYLVHLLRKL